MRRKREEILDIYCRGKGFGNEILRRMIQKQEVQKKNGEVRMYGFVEQRREFIVGQKYMEEIELWKKDKWEEKEVKKGGRMVVEED